MTDNRKITEKNSKSKASGRKLLLSRKVVVVGIVIVLLMIGVVGVYVKVQNVTLPVYEYQGHTAKEWEKIYNDFLTLDCGKMSIEDTKKTLDAYLKCEDEVALRDEVASQSAQIASLSAELAKKPKVVYKTQIQYETDPNLENQINQLKQQQSQPTTYHTTPGSNYSYGNDGSYCYSTPGSSYTYCNK